METGYFAEPSQCLINALTGEVYSTANPGGQLSCYATYQELACFSVGQSVADWCLIM